MSPFDAILASRLPDFSEPDAVRIAAIGLAASCTVQSAQGAIALNQLSACAELPRYRAALQGTTDCQTPTGRLARALNERTRSWPGV